MSGQRMRAGVAAFCVVTLCVCAVAARPPRRRDLRVSLQAAAPPPVSNACLIWPFQNRSGNSDLDWIGESFVILLRQQLSGSSVEVVSRSQRLAAMKLMGAPPAAELSHATLIGISQQAGARWLVTGWFNVEGDQLRAAAWVFDLQHEHLVPIASQTGTMADLESVQRRLAWAILQQVEPDGAGSGTPAVANDNGSETAPPLPLPAYESYVRAQMAESPAVKLKQLQVAAHFAAHDPRIEIALGEAYLDARDNTNALYWLAQVPPVSSLHPQAQFSAAIAEYRLGGYAGAAQMLADLEVNYPLPSVAANLATAKAQSRHPVQPAPELQTDFPIAGFRQLQREVSRFDSAKLQSLPADERVRQAYEAAGHLVAQGGLDAAALDYEKVAATAKDPHWVSMAHAGLADIWLKRNNPAQAEAEITKSLAAEGGNAWAQALQAQIQAQTHAETNPSPASTKPR